MKVAPNNFRWNPYADQPHNVASRSERFKHHFRYTGSYLKMIVSNLQKLIPILTCYRKHMKSLYKNPIHIKDPFGVSVSLLKNNQSEILDSLRQIGVKNTLVRIPSWERKSLSEYEVFVDLLKEKGMDVVIALIQQREDVIDQKKWVDFLEHVFSRFSGRCRFFEIGHAWNRTKWGLWNYKEYLELAEPGFRMAKKFGIKLLGPAVIDFEFHLYPPVLKHLFFDRITSLLYVDRVGAPENSQFGWDLTKKIALLKAVVDKCSFKGKELWITEYNWPIKGTGKYSPASGNPNVTEEQQANFLVRYSMLALTPGLIKRIYWWQLAAPGYGLIDNLGGRWRKRPSFFALKTVVDKLSKSVFIKKEPNSAAEIFMFRKDLDIFAVCWTPKGSLTHTFSKQILKAFDRDGKEADFWGQKVLLTEKPVYIYFKSDE